MNKISLTLIVLSLAFIFNSCGGNSEKENTSNTNGNKVVLNAFDKKFKQAREKAKDFIRQTIENTIPEDRIHINDIPLYSSVKIPEFYVNQAFSANWIPHADSLKLVMDMMQFIEDIRYHGLNPIDYHYDTLSSYLNEIKANKNKLLEPHFLAHFDILLSDAFFMMASHLYHGKVNPENLTAEWGIQRNKPALMLDEKLEMLHQSRNLFQFMSTFYPPHPGYIKMVEYAKTISTIHEETPVVQIPTNRLTLHVLEDTIYNELLIQRLAYLGYATTNELNYADSLRELTQAIKRLQYHHGLNEDGAIGRNTYNALIRSPEDKLKKLYVNMERLRWMPDSLETYYILVNIADYTLDYMKGYDTLLHMRTVVGKEYRQTPVFHGTMTYLVLSPTWTVPPGILRADVLPAVAKNVNYLAQKNMIVLDNAGNRIDPSSIDWQKARKGSFPYRIRQQPGAQNALGRVKFMFPNKYNVYLHDTPSRELFGRDSRSFSSGCIRIEKPYELTKLLLEQDERWNSDKIKQAMSSEKEQSVILKNRVGVYIYYLTAWSLANGDIHFRDDIYQRDDEVWKSLQKSKTY